MISLNLEMVSEFKLKSIFYTFCLFSAPNKCSLLSFSMWYYTPINGWFQLVTSFVQSSIDVNVILALFLFDQRIMFFIVPQSLNAISSISLVNEKPFSQSTSKEEISSQYFCVPIPSYIQFFMFQRYSYSLIFFSKYYFLRFSSFSMSLCLCEYSSSLLFSSSAILLLSLSILAYLFFLSSTALIWFLQTSLLAQLSKNQNA